MTPSNNRPHNDCCAAQKNQVVEDVQSCRDTYSDPESRHACFKTVARSSKKRAVACMAR